MKKLLLFIGILLTLNSFSQTDKNIYINDLIHRYAGHTFTETTSNDEILVQFKNASSVLIAQARAQSSLVLVSAYQKIRNQLLKGENPVFLSNTIQRNALVGVTNGTAIYNLTIGTGRNESYNGTAWESVAGSGVMSKAAYGSMYESNTDGSAMNPTTKQWITANVGEVDDNNLITFVDSSSGDGLLVGVGGSGKYMVIFSAGHTNAGNNITTAELHINGVNVSPKPIKDSQRGNITDNRPIVLNGIVPLIVGDYLTIHLESSTPADEINVFDCHLTIQRLN